MESSEILVLSLEEQDNTMEIIYHQTSVCKHWGLKIIHLISGCNKSQLIALYAGYNELLNR